MLLNYRPLKTKMNVNCIYKLNCYVTHRKLDLNKTLSGYLFHCWREQRRFSKPLFIHRSTTWRGCESDKVLL